MTAFLPFILGYITPLRMSQLLPHGGGETHGFKKHASPAPEITPLARRLKIFALLTTRIFSPHHLTDFLSTENTKSEQRNQFTYIRVLLDPEYSL